MTCTANNVMRIKLVFIYNMALLAFWQCCVSSKLLILTKHRDAEKAYFLGHLCSFAQQKGNATSKMSFGRTTSQCKKNNTYSPMGFFASSKKWEKTFINSKNKVQYRHKCCVSFVRQYSPLFDHQNPLSLY